MPERTPPRRVRPGDRSTAVVAADRPASPERTRSDDSPPRPTRAETVAVAQGAYFAATGVWPFVSMRSFEAVTGPKPEQWLVKTVGGLVGVVGAALMSAGLRKRVTPEMAILGAGTAAVLAGIDVWYAARRRISPVYLADAAAEALLIAGWASAARERADEDADHSDAPRGRRGNGGRRG